MKRNMDLVRLILLKIEAEHKLSEIENIAIPGFDQETIAYHCEMLFQAGLISEYKTFEPLKGVFLGFSVGGLTWSGHDFLEKIRDESVWGKTKEVIKKKGLPLIIETIKTIANAILTTATEAVVNSILKNGCG